MFGIPCHLCKKTYSIGEPAILPEPYVSPFDSDCQEINEGIEDTRHPIDGIGSMLKKRGAKSFNVGMEGSKFNRNVILVPSTSVPLAADDWSFVCDSCIEALLKLDGVQRLGTIHKGKEIRTKRILSMLAEEVI